MGRAAKRCVPWGTELAAVEGARRGSWRPRSSWGVSCWRRTKVSLGSRPRALIERLSYLIPLAVTQLGVTLSGSQGRVTEEFLYLLQRDVCTH